MPRFFITKESITVENGEKRIIITGDDAHHISRSLRMAPKEKIEACDSTGYVYLCELTEFTEKEVFAKVIEESKSESEPKNEIILFQALPKSDKMETIIQKTTECGVSSIVPFRSERCVVKLDSRDAEKKRERWQKIAESGAKQSGRGVIPKINSVLDFSDAVKMATEASLVIFCNEREEKTTIKDVLRNNYKDGKISVIIGSEGGFSEKEAQEIIKAGAVSVTLGKRILRCETAPTFVLSCIAYETEM